MMKKLKNIIHNFIYRLHERNDNILNEKKQKKINEFIKKMQLLAKIQEFLRKQQLQII